eukprot:c44424_g1_i1 orf=51-302(-)
MPPSQALDENQACHSQDLLFRCIIVLSTTFPSLLFSLCSYGGSSRRRKLAPRSPVLTRPACLSLCPALQTSSPFASVPSELRR